MEKVTVFTIYDAKLAVYSEPVSTKPKELDDYLRFLVNSTKTDQAKFSADFILYELGVFDEIAGSVSLHAEKRVLHSLSYYLENADA